MGGNLEWNWLSWLLLKMSFITLFFLFLYLYTFFHSKCKRGGLKEDLARTVSGSLVAVFLISIRWFSWLGGRGLRRVLFQLKSGISDHIYSGSYSPVFLVLLWERWPNGLIRSLTLPLTHSFWEKQPLSWRKIMLTPLDIPDFAGEQCPAVPPAFIQTTFILGLVYFCIDFKNIFCCPL